ncbi:MAG: type II secretion system major pseudopilin GspG [Verrucomicrobiota bacterium]|nr:type II secretion system major pseudopilin GspG [Verrucomicrobiota bacterium]
MKRIRSLRSGFTLLEIMMVVMIIALLAASAIYFMGDNLGIAQETRVSSDLKMLETQLLIYKNSVGFYPSAEQGIQALIVQPEPKPRGWRQLLKDMPRDPWQNEYFYVYPGRRNPNSYDLFSAGNDRKPETADDIGNWNSES